MPLPLFFIAGAAAAALGAKKTIQAGVDNSNAEQINNYSQKNIDIAKNRLNIAKNRLSDIMESYGYEKLFILNNSVAKFLESYEKIDNINFFEFDTIKKEKVNDYEIKLEELQEMTNFASTLLSGSVTGIASGTVAAFGAYSAATTLATASTGTAIASLSGAAASNATLAFLGGGSIAAGGLGIAGGTAVLGGLVAGPALMVMGFVTGAKASKNLEKAYENEKKSKEIVLELEKATDMCDKISRRTMVFYNLLVRLDSYFIPLVYKLEKIIKVEGFNYLKYTEEAKALVAIVVSVASTIKTVLDISILNEDGSLTEESKCFLEDMYK